ncbi:MAG: hypothetical protein SXG53_04405 [Pseudomonadota bacterium]|nr:hypothetical protein [Pseudomonadota bacterium]
MSISMRFTVPAVLALIASLAHAAEQPAAGARDAGTLSNEATAAGPAVDTSKTNVAPSSDGAPTPAVQPSATSQRAGGPQAVVRSDRLNLDTTVVTGNRELPKVLYIVPWKKSDLGDLPAQPFNTLLDEALTPVDRDVFRREVTYYGAMSGGPDAAPSQPERSEK